MLESCHAKGMAEATWCFFVDFSINYCSVVSSHPNPDCALAMCIYMYQIKSMTVIVQVRIIVFSTCR